jgi:hypothetical protein
LQELAHLSHQRDPGRSAPWPGARRESPAGEGVSASRAQISRHLVLDQTRRRWQAVGSARVRGEKGGGFGWVSTRRGLRFQSNPALYSPKAMGAREEEGRSLPRREKRSSARERGGRNGGCRGGMALSLKKKSDQ